MAQESLFPTEAIKPATIILQIVDNNLGLEERDRVVQAIWDHLTRLDLTPAADITPLRDGNNAGHRTGLQVLLREPDRISTLVKGVSDYLAKHPVDMRAKMVVGAAWLQIQTNAAMDLLGLLPALDTLLPARQLFQSRAEIYVRRRGELSPVERANLDLLCYRLNLPPEEADSMISRALGPYLDRQAKLQKYREVLSAELERESPLSETTWAELRQFYQGLGLDYEAVAPIDQEYITRIQAQVTLLQQQEEASRLLEEDAQLLAETRLVQEESQRQQEEQQARTEHYRQEFRQAIASTLYPSEFDRGRLEQARRLWEIDPEMVRAIERDVTNECYGPVDSNSGLDYSRLRQLLWLNQWEVADQETERLILSAFANRDMQPLDANLILQLNSVDIQTIDSLWARHSTGRFGFRAQHKVYVQHERRADDFLVAIGWQNESGIGNFFNSRKPYRDLSFDLAAPVGHLPTWRWGADTLEGAYVISEEIVDAFFLHLERCIPALETETVDFSDEGLGNP